MQPHEPYTSTQYEPYEPASFCRWQFVRSFVSAACMHERIAGNRVIR